MPYADPIKQRAAHNEAVKRWRARSAKRYAAQQAVKAALANGSLIKWPGCAACRRVRGLEAHHCDYDRPLDVVWLCMKCHKAAHSIVGFRDTEHHAPKRHTVQGHTSRTGFVIARSLNVRRYEEDEDDLRAVRKRCTRATEAIATI